MRIITTVSDLTEYLESEKLYFKTGFVPTMGALHAGHVALVERSVKENKTTIVSIFVNPRQFNDKSDFENYPVTFENDCLLLENAGCNILFAPDKNDIFNNYNGYSTNLNGIDEIYEGEFRPGHFNGVVDVVYRLFDLVKPEKAYFGEKDFQQLAIIKIMVKNAKLPIQIIPCEIVREESGLAMSSRNERLNSHERTEASNIYSAIKKYAENAVDGTQTQQLAKQISDEINKTASLNTEYVIFCEPDSLKPVYILNKNSKVQLCVAVWCNKIRLIDNISLHI
jgi:pantoate--beta-alanine ligase